MLYAKDYRAQAWQKNSGKWGTLALTYLVYSIIGGIGGALSMVYVGAIIMFVIAGPLTLGLTSQALTVVRGGAPSVNDIFSGFKNFANAFLANLINSILIALWTLLLIIPGIIKTYSYSMTYYIMCDDPSISANEARKKSMELMRGNKWRLFCLQFSFIGWWLLCILTLGILALWIAPYEQVATAAFYQSLLPATENADTQNTSENKPENNTPFDDAPPANDPFDNGVRL